MLVIEAHTIISDTLVLALRSHGINEVAAVTPDEADIASVVAMACRFTVVLVGLLSGDGRTTLGLIRSLVASGSKVLVLITDQASALTGGALRTGAEAVVHKDMRLEGLVATIRAVHAGRQLLTDDERAALLEHLPDDPDDNPLLRPFGALTEREAATLRHLVAGRSPKAIALDGQVTIHTVRKHIHGVLTKLDVQSQREALALARHAGWPVPGDVAPEPDAKPSHVTWSGSQSTASVPLQASFDERAHECHEQ